MQQIGYADKDNTQPVGTPRRQGRAQDFNEIKTVVNANANLMGYKAVDFEPSESRESAVCPSTGGSGEEGAILRGNRFITTRRGWLPGELEPEDWGRKTIMEALDDNPGQDPTKWKYY